MPRRPAGGGGRGLPLRPRAQGERGPADRDGRGAGFDVVGVGLAATGGATAGVVDPDPRAGGRRRRGRGGRPAGAAPPGAGTVVHGDGRGALELGFPTANVAVPRDIALPARASTPGGTSGRTARPTRRPSRWAAARPSTTDGRAPAGRGLPARLRRRPLRRGGPGRLRRPACARSGASSRSTPWSPRCTTTWPRPAGCSPAGEPGEPGDRRGGGPAPGRPPAILACGRGGSRRPPRRRPSRPTGAAGERDAPGHQVPEVLSAHARQAGHHRRVPAPRDGHRFARSADRAPDASGSPT